MEKPVTDPRVAAVLTRLQAGESYSTAEVLRLQPEPGIIPALIAGLEGREAKVRRAGLNLLSELGRPMVKGHGEQPERITPYLGQPEVVALLVRALDDPAAEVRDFACKALAEGALEPLLQRQAAAIVEALRRHPATDLAALLLGKTSSPAARALIEASAEVREADPEHTEQALGRLGDAAAEEAVLRAYRAAKDPRVKARQALRLGYMATPKAVRALAHDIRTPDFYVWQMRSRRSMRVHVIAGLQRAFPTEPVLWPPVYKPQDDSCYEAIESFLHRQLGVTWDKPRPPFLWEEDAPVLR